MENLESILKLVDSELGAVAKNGKFRAKEEIDAVYKLMDIAKDTYCIWEYEDKMDDGDEMSFAGPSYARSGRMDYSGNSYARGRRNARRDSMGRYSRDGRMGGYSRADGKEEYLEHLRDMMEDAPDEQTRQDIKRMITKMEQTM